VRGSAPYKRELLRVYVRRAVRQAFDALPYPPPLAGEGREGARDGEVREAAH
jgi:hypothetical protein